MKKAIIALITILMLSLPMALAQETEVQDAGTTPDSALYGLDKAMERISLALTFGKAAKAQKRLRIANERMAELQAMVQKGKPEYAQGLMAEKDKNVEEAISDIEEEEAKGKDMSQVRAHVSEMQQKHITVLQGVLEKVPEQAKQAIQRNIERSQTRQQRMMQAKEQKGPQAMAGQGNGKPADAGQQMQTGKPADVGKEHNIMTNNAGKEQGVQTQAQEGETVQAQQGNQAANAAGKSR